MSAVASDSSTKHMTHSIWCWMHSAVNLGLLKRSLATCNDDLPVMLRYAHVSCGWFACAGVYALHSKLNHSCRPNVVVVSGAFYDSTIEVTAARDIAEGEELCFSYTNPKLSRVQRRRVLLANHFFHCMCPECVVPTATTPSAGPIVEATS